MEAIGFRLYGMERGIDYSYDREKKDYALLKWRRQNGFKKKLYVVLLALFW